jgi:hypothetical protein
LLPRDRLDFGALQSIVDDVAAANGAALPDDVAVVVVRIKPA